MTIDSRYIPAFSIEDVLLDKDTGAPLSGGLVYFEQDAQRGVLKPVYQITGTSPDYTFTQLPNPMTLSAIGTFVDALDNPVIPYFFPYNDNGDVELYYVRVTSSEDVPQFDRQAQPYINSQNSSEILSVITNELSNPQFAVVNFNTSAGAYTFNVNTVTDYEINIAPDWDLVLSAAGLGSVTVTQLEPTGSVNILTNPGTILTITSSGLSKLHLRQRIYGSPNLWGSGYLSATFVAKTYSGTATAVPMYYSQSNGSVVDQQFLPEASLPASGDYESFKSNLRIDPSTSADTFANGYIDIYFDLPLSVQIDITSIMVAFTGDISIDEIDYDQTSYARQIDQLYHDAYPIIPVGGLLDFAGFAVPEHYLLCDGTAINRIDYNLLFQALTTTETVSLTSGSPTFTVASASDYYIGMPIEGTGIAASTTISNIVGTTITMSNNATSTTSSSVRFFATGVGNGSTTFNVPDLRDYVTAGAGGSLFGAGNNGIGKRGGAASHSITAAELPVNTAICNGTFSTQAVANGAGTNVPGGINTWGTGSGTAMSLVQQTALIKKCIRYQ